MADIEEELIKINLLQNLNKLIKIKFISVNSDKRQLKQRLVNERL